MENTDIAPASDINVVLEQNQRLSQSLLWKLQRNFYEQQGIHAWSRGQNSVPHYITCNPFIARAYSKVVFAFLRDCQNPATPLSDGNQPFYILELGSGSGRFAYLFLKSFLDMLTHCALKDFPFKYIMTDFSKSNLACWQTHSWLQPFVEQGILDFACFDAEKPQDLTLLRSGTVFSVGTVVHPIVVLSNYVFDSIPQDCFTIKQGQLSESLLTITSTQGETDLNNPDLLTHLTLDYQHRPITVNYYDDPDFNQILQTYQERLADTTILFPYAALQCLRYFRDLSDGRLLLLSGDKGYSREQDLLDHGSFSMMVNYHAIGEYSRNQGGKVLHIPRKHSSLSICACLLGQHPNGYLETTLAFLDAIEQWGPDDFFTFERGLEQVYATLSTEQLLTYLRLSGWDSNIFLNCYSVLRKQVESASASLRQELYQAIQQVWNMYYSIGEENDLPFKLGSLMYAMDYYPEALNYYQHSLSLYGPDAATMYNMSLCYYCQRHWEAALEYIDRALKLDPAHEGARAMRIRVQPEIGYRP